MWLLDGRGAGARVSRSAPPARGDEEGGWHPPLGQPGGTLAIFLAVRGGHRRAHGTRAHRTLTLVLPSGKPDRPTGPVRRVPWGRGLTPAVAGASSGLCPRLKCLWTQGIPAPRDFGPRVLGLGGQQRLRRVDRHDVWSCRQSPGTLPGCRHISPGWGTALPWPPRSPLGVLAPQEPEAGGWPPPPRAAATSRCLTKGVISSPSTAHSRGCHFLPAPCRIFGK